MKNSYPFLIVVFLLILTSCATVKLSDAWKSDNFNALLDEKIVVVANAEDKIIGKALEIEIADRLRKKGIVAIESHLKYPSLLDKGKRTDQEHNKIMQQFKNDNVKGAVVTALKDTKIKTQIINKERNVPYFTPENASFISFKAYNFNLGNLSSPPPLPPVEMDNSPVVLKSKTYFLEAVTYNLTLEEDKQLVGVTQADVTDPDNLEEVVKGFSKIVAKQFQK